MWGKNCQYFVSQVSVLTIGRLGFCGCLSRNCNLSVVDNTMLVYMTLVAHWTDWGSKWAKGWSNFLLRWCRSESVDLGPVSLTFFHRNSNSMEISFHSHVNSNTMITTKFCTWHDSCAVVACAKNCCDLMASNRITARWSFVSNLNCGQKIVSETGPWSAVCPLMA